MKPPHIIHISRKTLDEKFSEIFKEPIQLDVVGYELEDRFVIKFSMPNIPFIYICNILIKDLLSEITQAGYELTAELVDQKLTEFRTTYMRFVIKEEIIEEVIEECQATGLSVHLER